MITIPNIPSDSIYKFYFVSGIVLIIFSFYTQYYTLSKITGKLQTADSIKVIRNYLDSTEFNSLKKANNTLDKIGELQKNIVKKHHLKVFNHMTDFDSVEYLKKLYLEQRKYSKEDSLYDLDNAKVKLIMEEEYNEVKKDITDKNNVWITYLLGAILFTYGSCMWTIKIQKPQDQILTMQVKIMEKQLNDTSNIKRQHYNSPTLSRKSLK